MTSETFFSNYRGLSVRIYHQTAKDSRRTLLLFNGIGQSIEVMAPIIEALGDRNILTYDVPGTGLSDTPLIPWTMRAHSRLATHILDLLELDVVDVLGFSWGGVLAQHLCRYAPDRVARLMLAAAPPGQLMIPGNPLVYLKMSHPNRFRHRDYMRSIAPDIYGGDIRASLDVVDDNAKRLIPPPPRGYMYQGFSMVGTMTLLWLSCLKQPTLIMQGDDDPMIPNINARLVHMKLRNSELEFFDCGHLFMMTRTKRLVQRIDRFLAANEQIA